VSYRNVEASLDAVVRALDHFATSLERGGFSAGAEPYGRMAEVIIGQWLWAEQNNASSLVPEFARVARLAARVDDQLRPYVNSMQKIRALEGLIADKVGLQPDSPSAAIVAALTQAARPMSAAELRAATGASINVVRRELKQLTDRNIIAQVEGRARRFVPTGAQTPS
jgi:hypothetical protein